ncbi:MAG: glycoside hydrolase family 32 protein [Thermoguttaceae bacterium]
MTTTRIILATLIACFAPLLFAADDIIVADFEGGAYPAGWKVEGSAFGDAPAQGSLDGQMPVAGFLGKGLVNTFRGGDDAKGKLTSTPIKIDRRYLSFLVGGGGHNGLAVNLLVDGKIVQTARGTNVNQGGTERLDWCDLDVAEFKGREAVIEIVDSIGGSWGHINVDQIILSDVQHAPIEKRREFAVEKQFLQIPIKMGSPITWVRLEVDGVWQQEFDCPLATTDDVDFHANIDLSTHRGKKLTLIAERVAHDSRGLELITQGDSFAPEPNLYNERLRPQFHFSPRTGWTNDPNGLVYDGKLWHLFYQHNPYSTAWGNMTWGHATSPDLFHWTEHADAIHPDKLGTIFSGSGVVDWKNSSGFQKAGSDVPPLVFFYTYEGSCARFGAKTTQGVAYSLDNGKTFTKYEKNPVIPHIVGGNRDPKVIWHEPSQQWILALYMDGEDYALFGSPNLTDWNKLCDIQNLGCSECPDFFPLAVDGDAAKTKWVFWGGNGKYLIGSFDGKTFTKETNPLTNKFGGNDYAAMTFSDAPGGRRIQFSWMQGGQYPGMPFNQQFTVPRELTLRTTPQGVRLFMEPVRELESLRIADSLVEKRNVNVTPRDGVLIATEGDLLDAEITIDLGKALRVGVQYGDESIVYDTTDRTISLSGTHAPLELRDNKLTLRIVVDRTSIEVFAEGGEVQIAKCFVPKPGIMPTGFHITSELRDATINEAKVWKLKSVW